MREVAVRAVRGLLILVTLVLFGAAAAGCATTKPWERALLADPTMNPDPDSDRIALRGHFMGVREGAVGGLGKGGGGCGCN